MEERPYVQQWIQNDDADSQLIWGYSVQSFYSNIFYYISLYSDITYDKICSNKRIIRSCPNIVMFTLFSKHANERNTWIFIEKRTIKHCGNTMD